MGEEGMQPYNYDRQVEQSEAYRQKIQNLEQQQAFQQNIKPKPLNKKTELIIGITAIIIIAGLILATATVCLYPLPQ